MGLGRDNDSQMHPFIIVRDTVSIEAFKFHLESEIQDFLYTRLMLSKTHENSI